MSGGAEPLRDTLYRLQEKRCYLCDQRLARKAGRRGRSKWSIDHVRPKRAGASRTRNALLAHESCNIRKGGRQPYPCEILFLDAINERLALVRPSHEIQAGVAA